MAFDFIKRLFVQPKITTPDISKEFGVQDYSGSVFGPRSFSDTGVPVTPWSGIQSAPVYACVKVLSEDVAKLPLRVYRKLPKGGWAPYDEHPLTKLLRRPNDNMTPFDFWAYLITCQQLRGNGYVYIERDGDGNPISLIPIIPDRVVVLLSPKGQIFYRFTAAQTNYQSKPISPEDMIHIKNMSLDGGITGSSVIWCSQNVIGLALAAQKNAATLFRQGSLIRGVLTAPAGAKLTKPVADRMAESWSSSYAGSDNASKVALLEEGTTFSPVTMTAVDAELLDARKFSGEEIARIFRVPQHKIGILDHATFSNIENQEQSYINDALMTICRRVEESLEWTLLFEEEIGKIKIRFDFDELLRGDFKTRMEGMQIATLNGYLSANEVRARESFGPPVAGGDEYRFPLNQAVSGDNVAKPTDSKPDSAAAPKKARKPKATE